MDINTLVISGVPMLALTIGLTAIAKKYINTKWIPLVSLAIGIITVAAAKGTFSVETLVLGLMVGLTASGSYSQAKTLITK